MPANLEAHAEANPITTRPNPSFDIQSPEDLLRRFEPPKEASLVKELDFIDANYAAWIAASPFLVLCTAGGTGLDASPRGDPAGFVRVLDSKTLIVPDRRGNNRLDSLLNLLSDPGGVTLGTACQPIALRRVRRPRGGAPTRAGAAPRAQRPRVRRAQPEPWRA